MDDTRADSQRGDENHEREHFRLAPIDHDEYDALAELFLGGGGYAPEPVDQQGVGGPGDARPEHKTHTPLLHLAGGTGHENQRESAQPFRPDAAGVRVIETLEETGDRASSLMRELMEQEQSGEDDSRSGPDEDGRTELVPMPNPEVELVVLGHLPVRATLWARQYACSSAKESNETIALIRAAAGSTAIDLVTDDEPISTTGAADLGAALDRVSDLTDRVILRVDEASEPELLERPEVGTITILTGADEAAVVASYRLIKTLDASLVDSDHGESPKLRLAVMGAGPDQARDACEKLKNAVKTFISRPIEIVAGAGRIDATGTTNIFRDTAAHPTGHIIDGLVRAAHREQRDRPETIRYSPADHAVHGPEQARPGPEIQTRIRDASTLEPKPMRQSPPSAAPAQSPRIDDGLCVLIPGLRAIEARCPKAPGVELAADETGRLHVLVCDADTSDGLNRLYAAQNWARDHLSLLLRAEPKLRIPSSDRDEQSEAMMHLISTEPASMREIYDTPVRLYALARVVVGGVVAQVATPLN